jgi:uncharacterized caspase-like protein
VNAHPVDGAVRLWPVGAVTNLYAATLVGLAAVVAGWWGASGADRVSGQLAWLNAAVVGVVVASTANVVWILRGRRAVGMRSSALLGHLAGDTLQAGVASAEAADGTPDGESFLAVAGLGLFHRAGCPMLTGKAAASASADEHRRVGRSTCGVCRP